MSISRSVQPDDADMSMSVNSGYQYRGHSLTRGSKRQGANSLDHRRNTAFIQFLRHDLLYSCNQYRKLDSELEAESKDIATLQTKIKHLQDIKNRERRKMNSQDFQEILEMKQKKKEKLLEIKAQLEKDLLIRPKLNESVPKSEIDFFKPCDEIAYSKAVEILKDERNPVFQENPKKCKTLPPTITSKRKYDQVSFLIEEGIKKQDENLKNQKAIKEALKKEKQKLHREIKKLTGSPDKPGPSRKLKNKQTGISENRKIQEIDEELKNLRSDIKSLRKEKPKPWEEPTNLPRDSKMKPQIFHVTNMNNRESRIHQPVFDNSSRLDEGYYDNGDHMYVDKTGQYHNILDEYYVDDMEEGNEQRDGGYEGEGVEPNNDQYDYNEQSQEGVELYVDDSKQYDGNNVEQYDDNNAEQYIPNGADEPGIEPI